MQRVLCVLAAVALARVVSAQPCALGQFRNRQGCQNCPAGQASPDMQYCYMCHDNSGIWPAGQGGRGFVRSPTSANCTAAERVCQRGQFVSGSGACSNCGAGQSSPDWAGCYFCSDDANVWPAGLGGRGFVKAAGQQACAAATSACSKGQYALNGTCANCPAGQSSPDGIVCRSCSDASGVWPAGQGGAGYVKATGSQACVSASVQCAAGQIASGGLCVNCGAGMSGLNNRCWFCNEPGVWPAGQGGPGWVKSAVNQGCIRAKAACANLQYSLNGACSWCPAGTNSTDGVTCLSPSPPPPKSDCTINCSLLNTDCRSYVCSAAMVTCVISLNRTGDICNGTRGTCASGVCVSNSTNGGGGGGGGGTNTGTIPPDSSVWPDPSADTILRIRKEAGLELVDANGYTLESQWMHLHVDGDPAGRSVTLTIDVIGAYDGWPSSTSTAGLQVRYTVQDVPISPWLSPSNWKYTITQDSPMLANFNDGVLDISLQVMGSNRMGFKPWPAFLHLKRNRPISPLVPVMVGDNPNSMGPRVPVVTRVARSERRATAWQGYPANSALTRWSTVPQSTDLYLEQLTPGGSLFEEMQMWWEDLPSHPNLTFIRGLQPYQGEDPRGVNHARLPAQDGPRGVGWMSGYVSGKVDNSGRFVFAELSGRVGWLMPTGEIITIAGWVTKPGLPPVWIRKPLEVVRSRQVLRGQGSAFQAAGGFGRPIDTAFNPDAPSTMYVSDHLLNCIWMLSVGAPGADGVPSVTVSLLAGSATDTGGYQDGPAASAQFNEPFAISWAIHRPTNTPSLYVADSANHAIRRIDLTNLVVSTMWGGPGAVDRLNSLGIGLYERATLRTRIPAVVTAAAAAGGSRPFIYWPFALRTDNQGNVIILEHGYALIRRLDPVTNSATTIAGVDQLKFGEYDHGWAWLDVDVTGAAGPVNGIYWCMAVGDGIPGLPDYKFNEVFAHVLPQANAQSRFIFTGRGGGANPVGFGARNGTTPPHYPWLVAVDPRGGVLMSGMGVHGISRLRVMDPTRDPTATESYPYFLGDVVFDWPGVGFGATSLAFRAGNGGHGMMGLGVDGWATRGFINNDTALLEYYGAAAVNTTGSDGTNLLEYLRKQTGPARDNLPTAPPDSGPPTTPTGLTMAQGHLGPNSIMLRWTLASDDRAVGGYTLQLVRTLPTDTGATGAALFAPSVIAQPINAELARFNNAWLGNTEGALLEALATGYRYYARLAARDLAGKLSQWSEPVSLLLANSGTQSRSGVKP